MKVRITDPETIRRREQDLFGAIAETLDQEALSTVFRQCHRLEQVTEVASRQGDLIARKDEVVYRLDFDVRAVLTVLFDRAGNYLAAGPEFFDAEAAPDHDAGAAPAAADTPPAAPQAKHREEDAAAEPDTIGLEQILRGRSDMIQDPPALSGARGKPPPREEMSRMATELADMISDINGKKKT